MHERLLSRAAKPAPVVILGLLLRPYSLGHELCLIEAGNPLWNSNDGKPADVAEAVWICAGTWRQNSRGILDRLFFLKKKIWKTRLRWNKNARNHALNLRAFVEYRDAGTLEFKPSQMPRTSQSEPRAPAGAPFLLRLQSFLMLKYGFTEEQAWDYPYGMANHRWMEFWESEGCLEIFNEWDVKHDTFVAEQEAKGLELLKAKGAK